MPPSKTVQVYRSKKLRYLVVFVVFVAGALMIASFKFTSVALEGEASTSRPKMGSIPNLVQNRESNAPIVGGGNANLLVELAAKVVNKAAAQQAVELAEAEHNRRHIHARREGHEDQDILFEKNLTNFFPYKEKVTRCPVGNTRSRTYPQFDMCHHGGADVVSSWFMRDGYWHDCLILPSMAFSVYEMSKFKTYSEPGFPDGRPIVVEVGGNIGTCAMLMASQGIDVITFEPVPVNIQMLGASISVNYGYDKRISLVAAAATDFETAKQKKATIFIEPGNKGNSMLAKENRPEGKEFIRNMPQKAEIQLTTLDAIVHNHVHLLKLDCQGSELLALRGASKLLQNNNVDMIRAEVDGRMLRATGTDPRDLIRFLLKLKFTLFIEDSGQPVTSNNLEDFAKRAVDFPTDIVGFAPQLWETTNNKFPNTDQEAILKHFGVGVKRAELAKTFTSTHGPKLPGDKMNF